MDRRGTKRKLSSENESLIERQVTARMDSNEKTQNRHLVDFIMNIDPHWHPSIGYLNRLKKQHGIGSRYTTVVKKGKEKTNEEKDDEYDLLADYYDKVAIAIGHYGSSGVWNYDEKPLSTAPKKVPSFQHKNKKSVPLVSKNGDPDRVYTAACAVAANGTKLPLTIIKKGVRATSASSQVVSDAVAPFGNYMALTKKGWVSGDSMLHWLIDVFAVNVSLPCALILDGYRSHWTDEVQAAAKELRIELISMPANHTDEIQPLDVGVFGALQSMTDRDWETDSSTGAYLNSFQQAWVDFKPESIRKAFYNAVPLQPGILEDHAADQNARQHQIVIQDAMDEVDAALQGVMDEVAKVSR